MVRITGIASPPIWVLRSKIIKALRGNQSQGRIIVTPPPSPPYMSITQPWGSRRPAINCHAHLVRVRGKMLRMGQQQTRSQEFSLLCWNIFGLERKFLQERTSAVCELVKQKTPDVVYFQEVVPSTWDMMQRELGGDYDSYRNESVRCHYYHILMVRKRSSVVPAKDGRTVTPFPGTNQGRHLLRLSTTFNGIPVHFMTSHLESLPTDREERKAQLRQCFDIMKDLEENSGHVRVRRGSQPRRQ